MERIEHDIIRLLVLDESNQYLGILPDDAMLNEFNY